MGRGDAFRVDRSEIVRRLLGEFLFDESGQSTTEYILLIAMISIPIYAALKKMMEKLIGGFVKALIQAFTRG